MKRRSADQWRRAGAVEFCESGQYVGAGETGRTIIIRAAGADPDHWLTIPAGQLAATGLELAAAAGSTDLLGREIRRLHSSANALLRHPGASVASLLMDRYRLAGLIEAHMIITGGWKGSGEPMVLVEQYGVDTFGISLARLGVAIETKAQ